MPSVDIDVQAKVVQRSLRSAASDMTNTFQRAGQTAGQQFGQQMASGIERQAPRVQAAMVRMSEATRKLREEQQRLSDAMRSGDYDAVVTASGKVERAYRDNDRALQSLATAQELAATGATALASGAASASTALGKMGPAAGVAVVGLQAAATSAASLVGVVGLIPGVLAAAGVGFGTLALGTQGFADALASVKDPEKFAEALRGLAPTAQQTALQIRQLVPAFDQLRNATQDRLFEGIGPQLSQLSNALLPGVQSLTTSVAGSFNQMFSGVATQLQNPATMAAITSTFDSIKAAFENVAPAAAPLTAAIVELTSASAGFLPELASGVASAATQFSQFITTASQSGDIERWIQLAVDGMAQLGPLILQAAQAVVQLAPLGAQVLPIIVDGLSIMLDVLNLAIPAFTAIAQQASPFLNLWAPALSTVSELVGGIGDGFNSLTGIVANVANSIIPIINGIGEAIDAAMAPLRAAGADIPNFDPIAQVGVRGGANVPKTGGIGGTADGLGSGPQAGTLPPGLNRPRGLGGAVDPGPVGWSPVQNNMRGVGGRNPSIGGGGGSGSIPTPVTPYSGDPMELLGGQQVTSSLYGSASSVLDARNAKAQAEAKLNALEASNMATAQQIQDAKNDVIKADQAVLESELRLQEGKLSAADKATRQFDDAATSMEKFGNEIAKDFGLSKGLPGLAEQITLIIGDLATAGYRGQLQAIMDSDPAYQAQLQQQQGSPIGSGPSYGGTYGQSATQAIGSPTASGAPSEAQVKQIAAAYGLTVASEDRPGDPGYHGQGKALDLSNSSGNTPEMAAFAQYMKSNFGPYLKELIYNDPSAPGVGINDGVPHQFSKGTMDDHKDHVHVAADWGSASTAGPGAMPGLPIGGAPALGAPAIGGGAMMPNALPVPLPVIIVGGGAAPVMGPLGGPPVGGPPLGGPPVGGPPVSSGFAPPATGWMGPGLPGGITGGGGQSPVLGASPLGPGAGASAGAGVQQPVGRTPGSGGWQAGGGGGGIGAGGMAMSAASAAAGAANLVAPGAGQAAQASMELVNRSIKFGGQLAAIGASGLAETFLFSGSELGDPSKSWAGRLASGVSGMQPASPTTAGQSKPAVEPQQHQGTGAQPGPQQGQGGNTFHTTINQNPARSNASVMSEMQYKANHNGQR